MDEAVITVVRLGELVEASAAPIKVARVDDDAADTSAMPTNKFGQAMYDYVGTVLDWAAHCGRGYSIVDDKR